MLSRENKNNKDWKPYCTASRYKVEKKRRRTKQTRIPSMVSALCVDFGTLRGIKIYSPYSVMFIKWEIFAENCRDIFKMP